MEGSNSYSSKRMLLPLGSDVALGKSALSEPFTLYLPLLFRLSALQGSGCHCVFVEHLSKVQKIMIWLSPYLCKNGYICKCFSSQQHYSTSLSLHLSLHHFLCLVTTLHFSLNYFQLNHNPPFLSCLK